MPPKIIVDANILVAAYTSDGELRSHWRHLLSEYKIVISPEIFIETEARLRRTEFFLTPEEIRSALKEIAQRCEFVRPSPPLDAQLEDTAAALARHKFPDGAAPKLLITANERLLRETEIDGCKIVRIEDFTNALRQLQPA